MQINRRMLPRKPRAVPRLTTSPTTISGDSSDSSCIVAILEPIETKTTRAATICHDSVLTVGNHSCCIVVFPRIPRKCDESHEDFPVSHDMFLDNDECIYDSPDGFLECDECHDVSSAPWPYLYKRTDFTLFPIIFIKAH